jgi:hypothetical protein
MVLSGNFKISYLDNQILINETDCKIQRQKGLITFDFEFLIVISIQALTASNDEKITVFRVPRSGITDTSLRCKWKKT